MKSLAFQCQSPQDSQVFTHRAERKIKSFCRFLSLHLQHHGGKLRRLLGPLTARKNANSIFVKSPVFENIWQISLFHTGTLNKNGAVVWLEDVLQPLQVAAQSRPSHRNTATWIVCPKRPEVRKEKQCEPSSQLQIFKGCVANTFGTDEQEKARFSEEPSLSLTTSVTDPPQKPSAWKATPCPLWASWAHLNSDFSGSQGVPRDVSAPRSSQARTQILQRLPATCRKR